MENRKEEWSIRIKDLHNAAVRCIRSGGKYLRYEKFQKKSELIMSGLFNRTMKGEIKGFYLADPERFRAYHRSTKETGALQYSFGHYRNNELVPCGDVQMRCPDDLIREGFSSGIYRIIA